MQLRYKSTKLKTDANNGNRKGVYAVDEEAHSEIGPAFRGVDDLGRVTCWCLGDVNILVLRKWL